MAYDSVQIHSEAATVAALVERANTPLIISDPATQRLAVFPNGNVVLIDQEKYQENPKRKRARVELIETSSFINYVNAHKVVGKTHLFGIASEQGGSFIAILDYHRDEASVVNTAGWGEHTCKLSLVTTPEWVRWTSNNAKPMGQEVFADFLEDNMTDIIEPDAGALIDMAQLLQGKKAVTFKSGKNLKTGAIAFEYTEAVEATGGRTNGDMEVPDRFKLGIVPFVGAFGIEISARLRFRITDGGKLSFSYILDRPFKVIEEAFKASRQEIESKTGLVVHLGTASVIHPQS